MPQPDKSVQPPVPTLLLAGPPRTGKTDLLRRWASTVPVGERWTLITRTANPVLSAFDPDHPPAGQGSALNIQLAHDCACCSGRVVLRTNLARTLRMRRPDRLFIEATLDEHLPATLEWLSGPQWAGWIEPVRCMVILRQPGQANGDGGAAAMTDLALRHADVVCFQQADPADSAAPEVAAALLRARQIGGSVQWRIHADPQQLAWGAVEQALGSARRPV